MAERVSRCGTMAGMTAKEALLGIVQGLTEEEAEDLIDLLNMHEDPDELTDDELAAVRASHEAIEHGDFVTLDELEALLAE